MQSPTPPRVLFFSPYARWEYHTALEATWGHALGLRGADVRFVLCNGLSGACDVYRENLNPRPPGGCLDCQAYTAQRMRDFATPYEWLGNYLDPRVEDEARRFLKKVPRYRLLATEWEDLPIGAWAAASIHTQFRAKEIELRDPRVEQIVREFLIGTIKFARATDTLLDVVRPDTIALLNGRFFAHWAAIELAERRGVRWITHERGLRKNTVRFAVRSRLHDLATNRRIWDAWSDVPLAIEELELATGILEERRQGRNFSRLAFSPPQQDPDHVRRVLRLDARPVVGVFNSSDDETAAFPERRAGAFPDSDDFLPAVLDLARRLPEAQFVIRLHPNIAKREAGPNAGALAHGRAIEADAPANVRVIHPNDDVSSYTVIDLSDVGVVYGSTIGLEIAAEGKPVLCMAQSTYSHTGCATQVDRPEDLEPALRAALAGEPSASARIERARTALRWVWRYFREYSIPFELVDELGENRAAFRFDDVGQLQPGLHTELDAACDLLLGRTESYFPDPTAEERGRDRADEDRFLAGWLQPGRRLARAAG